MNLRNNVKMESIPRDVRRNRKRIYNECKKKLKRESKNMNKGRKGKQ